MIPVTHAVVYPRTVVIHAKHATVTHATMVGAIWLILGASPFAKSPIPALFRLQCRLQLNWLLSRVLLRVPPLNGVWNGS